jgi:hypothetical protein
MPIFPLFVAGIVVIVIFFGKEVLINLNTAEHAGKISFFLVQRSIPRHNKRPNGQQRRHP